VIWITILEIIGAAAAEARESPDSAAEEPERAEPRPGGEGAQEDSEGRRESWWRRIFGA
jgi:hypothetical protein